MDHDREQLIRDRAYSIWEEQGRPHGEDMRHWLQAWQELAEKEPVANEDASAALADPVSKAEARPVQKRTAKAAAPAKSGRRKKS